MGFDVGLGLLGDLGGGAALGDAAAYAVPSLAADLGGSALADAGIGAGIGAAGGLAGGATLADVAGGAGAAAAPSGAATLASSGGPSLGGTTSPLSTAGGATASGLDLSAPAFSAGTGELAGLAGGTSGVGAGIGASGGLAGTGSAPAAVPGGAGGAGLPAGSAADPNVPPDPNNPYGINATYGTPAETGTPGGASPLTTTPSAPPSYLDKALSAISGNPIGAASVGLGAASLGEQLHALSAQKQLQSAAAPAQALENSLMQQYQAGTLNPAQQAQVAQWSDQQKAQTQAYYAKAGLSNSSMEQDAMAQIDSKAQMMRQQILDSMLTSGVQAAGVANPLLTAGVTAGINQDQAAMTSMQNFLNQLAKMNTPQPSTTTPTDTTTTTGSPG